MYSAIILKIYEKISFLGCPIPDPDFKGNMK